MAHFIITTSNELGKLNTIGLKRLTLSLSLLLSMPYNHVTSFHRFDSLVPPPPGFVGARGRRSEGQGLCECKTGGKSYFMWMAPESIRRAALPEDLFMTLRQPGLKKSDSVYKEGFLGVRGWRGLPLSKHHHPRKWLLLIQKCVSGQAKGSPRLCWPVFSPRSWIAEWTVKIQMCAELNQKWQNLFKSINLIDWLIVWRPPSLIV